MDPNLNYKYCIVIINDNINILFVKKIIIFVYKSNTPDGLLTAK